MMADNTKPVTRKDQDRLTDLQNGAAATPAEEAAGRAVIAAARRTSLRPKKPMITAIEIENFKGIGAAVRIDLRPITLLFGRNSAGKSTILQALCYAHEILSHGNVDVHKTELGGDQVDLGGFRQFVHGHDLDRVVRLRFEMNLNSWRLPPTLTEKLIRGLGERSRATNFQKQLEANDSGWVELAVRAPHPDAVVIKYYEVGINGAPVGRLQEGSELIINWSHPLLESLSGTELEWTLSDPVMVHGLTRALPHWEEPLALQEIPRLREDDTQASEFIDRDFPKLRSIISGALVGVGSALRNELARLRYLGPVRELRPRTGAERDVHSQGLWSDGSAAWHLLLHYDPPMGVPYDLNNNLFDNVNHWLADENRLSAGYKLRRTSIVELPAEAWPVSLIREYEGMFATHRNSAGKIDLEGLVHDLAELVASISKQPLDPIEDRLRKNLNKLAAKYDALESGKPARAVKALVRAIATARRRTRLELLTAETGIEVRTSDIGIGISQILPVLVAALDPNRPGITAIEQPELHVHPRMQVELGDLFAQGSDGGSIFLIETHSEHLILRLLRRIEQTNGGDLPKGKHALKPDQLSVVFLEQINEEVRATRLRIDETGEFVDRWPQGFFRERAAELF